MMLSKDKKNAMNTSLSLVKPGAIESSLFAFAQGSAFMPKVSLRELAQLVGGQVVGDPELVVRDALPIQDAGECCITLADSKEQIQKADQSKACAIVVGSYDPACSKPLIIVEDIHGAFVQMIARLRPCSTMPAHPGTTLTSISDRAIVDSTASIGSGTVISAGVQIASGCTVGRRCYVHPNVTLMEGCRIGDDCELFPGAVLYAGTILGHRVLVHSNVVLGSYGFGYRQTAGKHVRTAQLGWVEIEDDVEIGAGSTIDRGTYGPTRVGEGTKLDNLVHIGHNCHIGKHNLLCAQVGIAGSCTTGDYVVMGGQAGLKDHLEIGSGAMLAARSGIMYDVAPGEIVFGSPAGPRKDKLREVILIGKLPEFKQDLQQLNRRVQELEAAQRSAAPGAEQSHDEGRQDHRAA
jgi:UDP-3-O-[3-hydroxymyristoyl] glucosamine N-acyltransferase